MSEKVTTTRCKKKSQEKESVRKWQNRKVSEKENELSYVGVSCQFNKSKAS